MANFEKYQETTDDFFNLNFPEDSTTNCRTTTRLIRNDITAKVSNNSLLSLGKLIPVDLLDISSKGVLISCNNKLPVNKKVTLTLEFKTGKAFKINAEVVRRNGTLNNEYGIKFDRYDNELGDYLFETQDKLIFK
ncbi:MAG: PilZ domain-containing protein [Methylococcaceae bacterium]